MQTGDIITNTLKTLKNRMEGEKNLLLQVEGGYQYEASCTFYDPVCTSDLENFMSESNIKLPLDYIKFLALTNGCRLFDDVRFGGEAFLLSLQQITKWNEINNGDSLMIGSIYQDKIYIDLNSIKNNEPNYMFVGDDSNDYRPINMNFELWFDRLVVSQGSKFWTWTWDTAERYYKRR
ncbi:SMI1/KNR4 family protein [Paenibacillus xanthanilyticus]|uniref:SMI1/KNR4 family protein n=1 Tax=Paenibacillus xanthanilyticus TaxID=1783531 RepID=A0ABV8K9E6_9BACL